MIRAENTRLVNSLIIAIFICLYNPINPTVVSPEKSDSEDDSGDDDHDDDQEDEDDDDDEDNVTGNL